MMSDGKPIAKPEKKAVRDGHAAMGDKPPGRPPGFSRDRATRAALDLFWKKGIGSVSSSELASAMGIARSSFYNSFGSKEALFGEVLGLYAGIAPDRLLDAIGDGQPVVPRLAAFLRELCHVRAADPEGRGCMICNGIAELAGSDHPQAAALRDVLVVRTRSMRRLFEQARTQGELPDGADPAALADAFMAFILGLNLMSKVVRDESRLQAACWQFLATVGISA